jgi:diaminopimelate decarboxylase
MGTPLYVVSANALRRAAAAIRGAFQGRGLRPEIFFSYKTNPVPEVLRHLAMEGVGAEVICEAEMRLARRLGLPGGRIIVNGSNKPASLLRQAVEAGAALVTVHSAAELKALEMAAAELGLKANAGLRINPGLKRRPFDWTVSSGTAASPIGLVRGSDEWKAALSILRGSSSVRFRGLHFHIGSGIRDVSPYREALKKTLGFFDDLLEAGLVPEILDIGGGFNISTLKEISLWEAVRLFAWNKPQRPPQTPSPSGLLRGVAAASGEALMGYADGRGIAVPKIYIEPGRALSGPSQILLLGVKSVIERRRRTAAVCDGGALSLSHLLLAEYHAVFVATKAGAAEAKKYSLYGSLPTPLDLVAAQRMLPRLSTGDVIAVMDTGAYFTSLGNNFAGPRPAIVMLEDGKAALIRRRETFDDLFARDIWPEAGIGS